MKCKPKCKSAFWLPHEPQVSTKKARQQRHTVAGQKIRQAMQDTAKSAESLNVIIQRKDGSTFEAYAGWEKTPQGQKVMQEHGLKLAEAHAEATQTEPQPVPEKSDAPAPPRFVYPWIAQEDFNREGKKFIEQVRVDPNPEAVIFQNAQKVFDWVRGFDLKEETWVDLLTPLNEMMLFFKNPYLRREFLKQLEIALDENLEYDVKTYHLEYPSLRMTFSAWVAEQKDVSVTGSKPINEINELTAKEKILIHCYEGREPILRSDKRYGDYITFSTPTKRKAYPNGATKKAKWLKSTIEKILPLLSGPARQQAESELTTIMAEYCDPVATR